MKTLRLTPLFASIIACVIRGQVAGLEIKAPKGRQSDQQKDFQGNLEAAGGRYILARSLGDAIR